MKKYLIIGLSILILATCARYAFLFYKSKQPNSWESNKNIPSGFLYTKMNEEIPQAYLIDYTKVSTFVVDPDIHSKVPYNDRLICVQTKQKPQVIEYSHEVCAYRFRPKPGGCSAFYRAAFVCGDKYIIQDFSLIFGSHAYGPFDLKK